MTNIQEALIRKYFILLLLTALLYVAMMEYFVVPVSEEFALTKSFFVIGFGWLALKIVVFLIILYSTYSIIKITISFGKEINRISYTQKFYLITSFIIVISYFTISVINIYLAFQPVK